MCTVLYTTYLLELSDMINILTKERGPLVCTGWCCTSSSVSPDSIFSCSRVGHTQSGLQQIHYNYNIDSIYVTHVKSLHSGQYSTHTQYLNTYGKHVRLLPLNSCVWPIGAHRQLKVGMECPCCCPHQVALRWCKGGRLICPCCPFCSLFCMRDCKNLLSPRTTETSCCGFPCLF